MIIWDDRRLLLLCCLHDQMRYILYSTLLYYDALFSQSHSFTLFLKRRTSLQARRSTQNSPLSVQWLCWIERGVDRLINWTIGATIGEWTVWCPPSKVACGVCVIVDRLTVGPHTHTVTAHRFHASRRLFSLSLLWLMNSDHLIVAGLSLSLSLRMFIVIERYRNIGGSKRRWRKAPMTQKTFKQQQQVCCACGSCVVRYVIPVV